MIFGKRATALKTENERLKSKNTILQNENIVLRKENEVYSKILSEERRNDNEALLNEWFNGGKS